MKNTVTLCENTLDPSTWTTHEDVEDVREFLVGHFGIWPENARIYLDHVANNADITPYDEAGIDRLGRVNGHFYIVVYPEGIELILIIVAIAVAAIALTLVFLFRPHPGLGQQEQSPNNQLGDRQNKARPNERIPDIFGQLWSTFDLISVPYRTFIANEEYEHCYMCIGRGEYAYNINDLRDDVTPFYQIDGASAGVYGPNKSPNNASPDASVGAPINEKLLDVQTFDGVNGQTLTAPNLNTWLGNNDIRFVYPNLIQNSGSGDFTQNFTAGEELTIGGLHSNDDLAVDPAAIQPSVHLAGTYLIGVVTSTQISLVNPNTVNSNWNALNAFSGHASTYRSIDMVVNGTFSVGITLNSPYGFILINPDMTGVICNFVAPNGVYLVDKKGRQDFTSIWTVYIKVVIQQCDSSGNPLGTPLTYTCAVAGNKTDRLQKATTLRIDLSAKLPGFAGILIYAQRISNTDPISRGNTCVDVVTWRDLYITSKNTPTDFGNVTTVQTLVKATLAAAAIKERKTNMLVTRKVPTWTGSAFSAPAPSKNAADILCAMALDPFIGDRVLSEIDPAQIYAVAGPGGDIETYFSTQPTPSLMTEFCYTFDDSKVSFEESASELAQAIFCVAYRRGSVLNLSFEKQTNDSVLLFNHRNKIPKSETRTVTFGTPNDNDGITLEYVEPNAPNFPNLDTVTTLYFPTNQSAVNPKKVTAVGVRNLQQATVLGWRLYNKLVGQNTITQFDATEEAALLVINDRVLVADNTRSDTQDGEVIDQASLLLTLSQNVSLPGPYTYTIFLQHPDATVESIAITAGPNPNQVVLGTAPSLPCVIDPDKFARTTYMIVSSAPVRSARFLLAEKTPKNAKVYEVKAINYTDDYYSMDGIPVTGGSQGSSLFMPTTRGQVITQPGGNPSYGSVSVAANSGEIDQWESHSLSFFGKYPLWDYSPAGVYAAPGSDDISVPTRSHITGIYAVMRAGQKYTWFVSAQVSLDGGATWIGLPSVPQNPAQDIYASILSSILALGTLASFDFTQVQLRSFITTSLNFTLPPPGNVVLADSIGLVFLFDGASFVPGSNDGTAPPDPGAILNLENPLYQNGPTEIDMYAVDATFQPVGNSVHYNARSWTISDPGSTPTLYYVTIYDPSQIGDSLGTLTSFISTTQVGAHWGEPGYVNIGTILAIHGSSGGGTGGGGTGIGGSGSIYRFLVTIATRGNYTFAHGLGLLPVDVKILPINDATARFQSNPSPPWDSTNVYLNASDDALILLLEIEV